jgi:hypothetical protein
VGGDPRARGTSNSDSRGSSYARRKRRQAVLDRDGNGTWALCVTCPTAVDAETMRLDRVLPGFLGGTYALENVRPQCERCSERQGGYLRAFLRGCITEADLRAHLGLVPTLEVS